MGAFEDILDDMKVPAEDRELSVAAFVTKHPEIHDAVIRRKEYNHKLDEMAGDRRELDGWREEGKKYNKEAGKWNFQIKLESDLEAASRRAQDLQTALEAGGDMNFDEVLVGLKDKGVVLRDEVTALVTKTVSEGAGGKPLWDGDVQKRLDTQSGAFEFIYAKTAPLITRYAKEFEGAEIPMEDFVRFCGNRTDGWKDVDASYKAFTDGKRTQLEVDRLKKENAEARELLKQAEEKGQSQRQPDDTSGNTPQAVGPLARRIAADRKAATEGAGAVAAGAKLGDGQSAAAGLEALKNGTLVTAD